MLNELVSPVRFTGGIGTVGVFIPQDPGGPDELSQQGKARFDVGNFWFKGQQMGCGQAPIKRYNRCSRGRSCDTIQDGMTLSAAMRSR